MTPSKVEALLIPFWLDGKLCTDNIDTIEKAKARVKDQLDSLRGDFKRILNPTPYKITVSEKLYDFMHQLWLDSTPLGELD